MSFGYIMSVCITFLLSGELNWLLCCLEKEKMKNLVFIILLVFMKHYMFSDFVSMNSSLFTFCKSPVGRFRDVLLS